MSKIKQWFDFKKIEKRFVESHAVKRMISWSKQHSFPGFSGVPIYNVVAFVYVEITNFDLVTRANSIAFSFFISLFPSLLTLFTLLPFLQKWFFAYLPGGDNFSLYLQEEIQKIMPGEAGNQLFSFIHDVTAVPRIGLLSFGFVLAIYFSSNGMIAMMRSFAKSYESTFKKRSVIKNRWIAIMLTAMLGLLLIASIVLIILGNVIIGWLGEILWTDNFTVWAVNILRWLSIIFLFYFGISFIYRFGAATHRKFHYFSAGTTLATILSLLTSILFSMYIDDFGRFDTYHKFYGSIATIIILMLWIQMNSLILLIGFELNAAIAVNRDIRNQEEKEYEGCEC